MFWILLYKVSYIIELYVLGQLLMELPRTNSILLPNHPLCHLLLYIMKTVETTMQFEDKSWSVVLLMLVICFQSFSYLFSSNCLCVGMYQWFCVRAKVNYWPSEQQSCIYNSPCYTGSVKHHKFKLYLKP